MWTRRLRILVRRSLFRRAQDDHRLQAAHPQLKHLKITLVPYSAIAGGNSLVATQGERFLAIFSIVTLLTLVIACANVANLLLGRAVIRQREMALRQSLGASRARIIRMLLAEGLVLSFIAGAAALLFAWWVSRAASGAMAPTSERALIMLDFTPDWTVAAYAIVLALVAMVVFTVAPAARTWRLELLPWLKAGEQGVVHGRSSLSSGLVIVQLASSVLLLTNAGLAYRSLFLLGSLDPGFNTRNLLLVTINTSGSAASPESNGVLLDTLRERLRGVPGVEDMTYARQPPRESWSTFNVRSAGSSDRPIRAEHDHVGPGYLQVLGLTPRLGRELAPEDVHRTVRSAVISHNLAEALWPGQSPLGRTMVIDQDQEFGGSDAAPQEVEVVGVTPDGFFSGVRRSHRKFVFLSAQQQPAAPGETTLYVRHSGSLDMLAQVLRDARIPIVFMRTWNAQLENITWPVRVLTMLLTLFAGGSLLIAGIGQYAVVSFDMRRRIRELGLRIALGASSQQVLMSVVRDGLRLTAVGLAIGFALSPLLPEYKRIRASVTRWPFSVSFLVRGVESSFSGFF